MRRWHIGLAAATLLAVAGGGFPHGRDTKSATKGDKGYVSIFDGKTLKGIGKLTLTADTTIEWKIEKAEKPVKPEKPAEK